jgi:hypothetical protein
VAISGTVKDAEAPFSPLGGIAVSALGNNSSLPSFDWLTVDLDLLLLFGFPTPVTDGTGTYSFVVPLDDEYEVSAFDTNDIYGDQSWDHHGGCGCAFDPIVVPDSSGSPTAVTGIDFDLKAYANWIDFYVYADDLNGDPIDQLLIHLDKWNGSTWDLDVDTQLTDDFGEADVFGLGDGDYRLRYSLAGIFKKVDSWYEPSYVSWPLFDSGFSVELPGLLVSGCSCSGYTTLEPDLTFAVTVPSGGGGGSTPGTPRRPAGGSGATFVTPTPTPTPSATPTSTPSPSSSPSESPSAGPGPTDEPEPTVNPITDFWWLWLLLLLILALIVFFLVRLFRGRA